MQQEIKSNFTAGSQHVSIDKRDTIHRFECIDTNHRPSWKACVDHGSASLRVSRHESAEWLEFIMCETPEMGRGRKETHFGLNKEAARALIQFLSQFAA